MMTILSQLKPDNPEPGGAVKKPVNAASDAEKQGQDQGFTRMMMGFLGMASPKMEGEPASQRHEEVQVNSQRQPESAANDGGRPDEEAPLPLLVGVPHLVAEKTAAGETMVGPSAARQQGNKGPAHQFRLAAPPGDTPKAPAGPVSGIKASATEGKGQGHPAADIFGSPLAAAAGNEGRAEGKPSSLPSEGNAQPAADSNKKTVSPLKATSGFEAAASDKNSGEKPPAGNAPTPGKSISTKLPGEGSAGNTFGEINAVLAKGLKAGHGTIENGSGQQKAFSSHTVSRAQKGTPKTVKSPATGPQDPALKYLMQQNRDNKDISKLKLDGAKLQPAGSGKVDEVQASSVKPAAVNSNIAQSLTAVQPDKVLFKPVQNSSTSFELDPSKLVSVENSDTSEVDMELQAQSEKDTSAGDDGKAPLRFNSLTAAQISKSGGRREFSAQLARHIQQQPESGKPGSTQSWNHHRLVMDDGQALNVSVRHAEGALQLQLSAGNSELNKIIQQHIDDIRQHLQEQMNVEIDLQLQHFGDQQAGSGSNQSSADRQPAGGSAGPGRERAAEGTSPKRTTRYLGFNNNEWTA